MPVTVDCQLTVDKSDNPRAVTQSDQQASVASAGGGAIPRRICVWCKGLRVVAGITVKEYNPPPNSTWEVGFVQVLRASEMKAHYGETVLEWSQAMLPCYDSTNDGTIPWYTAETHRQINARGQLQPFTFQDYPTSHLDPYLDNLGHATHQNRLTHYIKHNKFDLYLVLRKTVGATETDKILRHLRWSTTVEIQPRQGGDWTNYMYYVNGYRLRKHKRSVSLIRRAIVHRWDELPPRANGSANDHILPPVITNP